MKKISNEQIEQWEIESMIDSIGNCLELNSEFIKKYCGKLVADLLLTIPEDYRESAIATCIGEGYFPGGICSNDPEAIILPSGEIEFQFEGKAEDVFETPNELTIHGDLAYLYTGYGLVLPVDCKKLAENIKTIKESI